MSKTFEERIVAIYRDNPLVTREQILAQLECKDSKRFRHAFEQACLTLNTYERPPRRKMGKVYPETGSNPWEA